MSFWIAISFGNIFTRYNEGLMFSALTSVFYNIIVKIWNASTTTTLLKTLALKYLII